MIVPNLVLAIERTVVRIVFAQVHVHIHKDKRFVRRLILYLD
jgi:hypothetical protein